MFTRSQRAIALASSAVAICAVAASTSASAAQPKPIKCKGGSNSCVATISLAGGASNKKLRIALSDTDLKLAGQSVKPAEVKGAYSLTKGSYSLGGSLYTVTLNAVKAIPKGATLTLKFAVPRQRLGTPGK
ncbi:MAG TPA: hypothetical protein VK774_05620 [Solirubrobacteraceae bacterium]|jgi:hypothetical protein|nr:hypothetical protein [Solirubrobacteraceae bacterium]